MKATTWLAVFATTSVMCASAYAAPLPGWGTDIDAAFAKAKAENKAVLLEFTGSDWCPPCIMMRKEVFSDKTFISTATKDFVLVEIDIPQGDKELAKKNQPLVEQYKVDGFPTIILLDAEGNEFSRFYASEYPSTSKFLDYIQRQLRRKDFD